MRRILRFPLWLAVIVGSWGLVERDACAKKPNARGAAQADEASDSSEADAKLAAQRRQQYEDNQRAIAAAFQALPLASGAPLLTAQLGHSRSVNSLSLSADGRLLLSGSDDRTARLWSVEKGRELRRFVGQQSNVTTAALSADGRLVATGGGDDRTVRIWDAMTGAQRLQLVGHEASIGALAFAPDGKSLASIDWNGSLRVWDLTTGKQTAQHDKVVNGMSAQFAPDGKTVLTLDASDNVTRVDVEKGAVQKRHELKESTPAFAFSFDGTLAAISGRECDAKGESCRARVWLSDAQRSAVQKLPPVTDLLIRALSISPNKQRLAVGTGAGLFGKCDGGCALLLLELPSGRELWRQAASTADIKAIVYAPDGKSLFAAGNDGIVRGFDAATGRLISALGGDVEPVSAVAFSPDRKWLAVGTGNPIDLNKPPRTLHVILWDLSTGREARRLALLGEAVSTITFSADSRWLAAGSRGDPEDCPKCTARLWEVTSGREVQSFATDVRRGGFTLSPDGRTAAGSTLDADSYAIGLWDAQSGKSLRRVAGGEQWAFAFAPNGTALATVGGAGDVTLRDAKTAEERRSLSSASADMRPCVAFSPDGRLVAAGATSLFSSAVWDVRSGKVLARLDGHSRDVTDIRLSGGAAPGGSLVATASLDTTAILWAARTGKLQRVLAGHFGGVTAVAFSPDDKLVVTGSLDGTARLWEVATGRSIAQLVSFRDGQWLVQSTDGHFDASEKEPGHGYHFVVGDSVVPAEQAQSLMKSAAEPGLLRRVLSAKLRSR